MKGSDLVLEKSVSTEYVPTRVYRAHLKTFVFLFDKSQFYYTSSSTITCWISRCVRSPDTSNVKRKLSVFWERGSPDLPACGLRRGSKGAQRGPSSSTRDPRPSR